MRWGVLEGNVIAKCIDVDPDNIPEDYENGMEVPDHVGVGFTFDGTDFAMPARPAPSVDQVKAEASRRILEIMPEWKQRNTLARATILAEKKRENWTAEEKAAWDAGEADWARIEAIRAASNEIENKDPIPSDFRKDSYWSKSGGEQT